ncbi:MAG: small metal-binding protein SmbP [Methylobacter sp.]|nr:small metal-binding protein SmbP [Methylobacter sp.]
MKKLTFLCVGLLLLSASAFADDHHADVALEHATAAVIYGKNGHTSILLEHAKTALEHVLAASITAKGVSKNHLDVAATELQEAIIQSESGHIGTATKHAQAALREIKASNK